MTSLRSVRKLPSGRLHSGVKVTCDTLWHENIARRTPKAPVVLGFFRSYTSKRSSHQKVLPDPCCGTGLTRLSRRPLANMKSTRFFANRAHKRKAVGLKSDCSGYGRAAGTPQTDVSHYAVIEYQPNGDSLCSQPFNLIFRSPSRVQHAGTG